MFNTNDFAQCLPKPPALHLNYFSASVELTQYSVNSGFGGDSHEPVVINLDFILCQLADTFSMEINVYTLI